MFYVLFHKEYAPQSSVSIFVHFVKEITGPRDLHSAKGYHYYSDEKKHSGEIQTMKDANLEPFLSAYKEKMKELSMLSLICSCFYPEPRNINIYTYDGELPTAEWPCWLDQLKKTRMFASLS